MLFIADFFHQSPLMLMLMFEIPSLSGQAESVMTSDVFTFRGCW